MNNITKKLICIYLFMLPLFGSITFWGKYPFSIVFTGVIGILIFIEKKGKISLRITITDIYLCIFLLCLLFSTIIAIDNSVSSNFYFSLMTQLCIFIFIKINFKKIEIKKIYEALSYSGLMTGIINLYQVFESIRIFGYKSNNIFSNINYYATITAFTIPLIYTALKNERKKRYLYFLIINIFSVIFSFSKGAIGILIIYILVYIFSKISFKKMIGLFFSIIVVLIFSKLNITNEVFEKYSKINLGLEKILKIFLSNKSISTRSELNNISYQMISDNLFGVGIGNYYLATYKYEYLYKNYHSGTQAHNIFLSIFSETGIFTGVFFIYFLIRSFIKLWKIKAYCELLYFLGVLISITVYGTGLKSWYFWIGLALISKQEERSGNKKNKNNYKKYIEKTLLFISR